jgi:two-component system response regulator
MISTSTKADPAVVLLVEDDPGDQLLTKEAFESLRVPHELRIVSDGKEALDYLYQRAAYASDLSAPRPDLILLDLNMPRLNGQRVAEQIHADPGLRDIPIVVLTTSRRHEDMLRAYGRGVTSFITKPLDFEHFIAAVRDLERLIKFVLALKTVRRRIRLSDRQVFRLLRRQQELEKMTDTVFEQQMQQIEEVLSNEAEPTATPAVEAARRKEIVRVAQKILESLPERKPRQSTWARGAAPAADACPDTPGLIELARALESERGQPGNARAAGPPGKGEHE